MEEIQEAKWIMDDGSSAPSKNLLPNVGTWSTFSKVPDEDKAKIFNSMRGALIAYGLMENK